MGVCVVILRCYCKQMLRAPSARIQARREREAKATEDAARGQMEHPDHDRQPNPMNNQAEHARANHRRAEEQEFEQEIAYNEGINDEDEEADLDYIAEEEEESEEVELEPEEEDPEMPGPPMNDLVAVLTNQTRVLEEIARTQQEYCRNARGQEARLSEFMKFKPPTFDSTEDPLEADDWLREINKKLDIIHARGRDRVLLASHQLVGSAAEWWDNYSQATENPEEITWEEFQKTFREYHIPEGIMEMKAEEFRNLKQETMTVTQYIRKFMKLSRYAMDDINTDKKKQDRFRRGLNSELRIQLVTHIYPDFNTLMNRAILLENARSELDNDRKRRIKAQEIKQQERTQRFRYNNPPQLKFQPIMQYRTSAQNQLQQSTSFRNQSSVSQPRSYNSGTNQVINSCRRCYNCREHGHYAASCPYPNTWNNQYRAPAPGSSVGSAKSLAAGVERDRSQASGQRQIPMQSFSQSRVNNINVQEAPDEVFGEFPYVHNPRNSFLQV
jgi:Retrotransposon gag protein